MFVEKRKELHNHFLVDFMVGGASASVSKTLGAPLERVKILLQNQNEIVKSGKLAQPYSGMINCCKSIVREEGFFSLWRGNYTNILRYFPTQAFNFAFKDELHSLFNYSKETDGHWKWAIGNVLSGSCAGLLSASITYSLDYTRTLLISDLKTKGVTNRQYTGILDVYKKTIAKEGVGGLYRGFWINAPALIIYRGLYFGLYDTLKTVSFIKNNVYANFSMAFIVTVVATVPAYPFDTLRRRVMIRPYYDTNAFSVLSEIVRTEGWRALFLGLQVNILRSFAGATTLVIYDKIKTYFEFG